MSSFISKQKIKVFNLNGSFDLDPDLFSKICSTGNLISFGGDVDIPDDIGTFQLQKIEELILARSSITSENLNNLLANTPNLKKLDLSYCQNITGQMNSVFLTVRA
jgi:hypothetical protein